jgi:hypothetical protein
MHKNWCELKQGGLSCDCGETTVEKGRKYDSDVSDLRTRNAELQAKNKELEAALKTVQQYWGRINEKGLVATIKDLEAENKELVAFVRYVSEIDPREVSDPDNENPLSMGELQWGAKELLKQEGGENHG